MQRNEMKGNPFDLQPHKTTFQGQQVATFLPPPSLPQWELRSANLIDSISINDVYAPQSSSFAFHTNEEKNRIYFLPQRSHFPPNNSHQPQQVIANPHLQSYMYQQHPMPVARIADNQPQRNRIHFNSNNMWVGVNAQVNAANTRNPPINLLTQDKSIANAPRQMRVSINGSSVDGQYSPVKSKCPICLLNESENQISLNVHNTKKSETIIHEPTFIIPANLQHCCHHNNMVCDHVVRESPRGKRQIIINVSRKHLSSQLVEQNHPSHQPTTDQSKKTVQVIKNKEVREEKYQVVCQTMKQQLQMLEENKKIQNHQRIKQLNEDINENARLIEKEYYEQYVRKQQQYNQFTLNRHKNKPSEGQNKQNPNQQNKQQNNQEQRQEHHQRNSQKQVQNNQENESQNQQHNRNNNSNSRQNESQVEQQQNYQLERSQENYYWQHNFQWLYQSLESVYVHEEENIQTLVTIFQTFDQVRGADDYFKLKQNYKILLQRMNEIKQYFLNVLEQGKHILSSPSKMDSWSEKYNILLEQYQEINNKYAELVNAVSVGRETSETQTEQNQTAYISSLQSQLMAYRAENAQIKENYEHWESQIINRESEINSLKQQMLAYEQKIGELMKNASLQKLSNNFIERDAELERLFADNADVNVSLNTSRHQSISPREPLMQDQVVHSLGANPPITYATFEILVKRIAELNEKNKNVAYRLSVKEKENDNLIRINQYLEHEQNKSQSQNKKSDLSNAEQHYLTVKNYQQQNAFQRQQSARASNNSHYHKQTQQNEIQATGMQKKYSQLYVRYEETVNEYMKMQQTYIELEQFAKSLKQQHNIVCQRYQSLRQEHQLKMSEKRKMQQSYEGMYEQMMNMQQHIYSMESQRGNASSKIAQLQTQLKESQSAVEKQNVSLREQERYFSKLIDKQQEDFKVSLSDSENAICKLRRQLLLNEKQEGRREDNQLEKYQERQKSLCEENNDLERKLSRVTQEKKEMESTLQSLNSRYKEQMSCLKGQINALRGIQAQLDGLKIIVKMKNQENNTLKNNINKHNVQQNQIEKKMKIIGELQLNINEKDKQIAYLREKVNKPYKEIPKVNYAPIYNEVNSYEQQRREVDIARLKTQGEHKQSEIVRLSKELLQCKSKAVIKEKQLENEIVQLKHKYNLEEQKLIQVQHSLQTIREQMKVADIQRKAQENKIKMSHENEISRLEREQQELKRKCRKYQLDMNELEEKLDRAHAAKIQAEVNYQQTVIKNQSIMIQLKKKEDKIKQLLILQKTKDDLKTEKHKGNLMEATLHDKQLEIRELKSKNIHLVNNINNLKADCSNFKNKISEFNKQKHQLSQEHFGSSLTLKKQNEFLKNQLQKITLNDIQSKMKNEIKQEPQQQDTYKIIELQRELKLMTAKNDKTQQSLLALEDTMTQKISLIEAVTIQNQKLRRKLANALTQQEHNEFIKQIKRCKAEISRLQILNMQLSYYEREQQKMIHSSQTDMNHAELLNQSKHSQQFQEQDYYMGTQIVTKGKDFLIDSLENMNNIKYHQRKRINGLGS